MQGWCWSMKGFCPLFRAKSRNHNHSLVSTKRSAPSLVSTKRSAWRNLFLKTYQDKRHLHYGRCKGGVGPCKERHPYFERSREISPYLFSTKGEARMEKPLSQNIPGKEASPLRSMQGWGLVDARVLYLILSAVEKSLILSKPPSFYYNNYNLTITLIQ